MNNELHEKYNIPKSFKIGGQDFEVRLYETLPDGSGDFGLFSYVPPVISIATKAEGDEGELVDLTYSQVKNTFYHEMTHAFNYMWNMQTDELMAQCFANFMCEYMESKR
jgi:hypothetical protein